MLSLFISSFNRDMGDTRSIIRRAIYRASSRRKLVLYRSTVKARTNGKRLTLNNPEHGQLIREDVARAGGGECDFRDGGGSTGPA